MNLRVLLPAHGSSIRKRHPYHPQQRRLSLKGESKNDNQIYRLCCGVVSTIMMPHDVSIRKEVEKVSSPSRLQASINYMGRESTHKTRPISTWHCDNQNWAYFCLSLFSRTRKERQIGNGKAAGWARPASSLDTKINFLIRRIMALPPVRMSIPSSENSTLLLVIVVSEFDHLRRRLRLHAMKYHIEFNYSLWY